MHNGNDTDPEAEEISHSEEDLHVKDTFPRIQEGDKNRNTCNNVHVTRQGMHVTRQDLIYSADMNVKHLYYCYYFDT